MKQTKDIYQNAKEKGIESYILFNKLVDLKITAPDKVVEICKARNKEITIALNHVKKETEQTSKEDYWLCKCGSYHKGFPYKCPLKKLKDEIVHLKNKHTKVFMKKCKAMDKLKEEIEELRKEGEIEEVKARKAIVKSKETTKELDRLFNL